MKKLIIVCHPAIEESRVNKRWIEELGKYPELFTVHHLDTVYPDGNIDMVKEQALVEAHDILIFQFPLYWYSSPPLLKKWQDTVLTYGWAYGSKSKGMRNRGVALGVSVGVPEDDYRKEGKNRVTLEEVLSPFRTMTRYVNADFRGYFGFYDAESLPEMRIIDQGSKDYVEFLKNI